MTEQRVVAALTHFWEANYIFVSTRAPKLGNESKQRPTCLREAVAVSSAYGRLSWTNYDSDQDPSPIGTYTTLRVHNAQNMRYPVASLISRDDCEHELTGRLVLGACTVPLCESRPGVGR